MPLIRCPECGTEVSDQAAACVTCGCPVSGSNARSEGNARSVAAPSGASRRDRPLGGLVAGGIALVVVFLGVLSFDVLDFDVLDFGGGDALTSVGDGREIRGLWVVVAVKENGRELPFGKEQRTFFVFGRDSMATVEGEAFGELRAYDLDTTRRPRWLEYDDDRDLVENAIYDVSEDTLRIMASLNPLAGASSPRPVDFDFSTPPRGEAGEELLFVLARR